VEQGLRVCADGAHGSGFERAELECGVVREVRGRRAPGDEDGGGGRRENGGEVASDGVTYAAGAADHERGNRHSGVFRRRSLRGARQGSNVPWNGGARLGCAMEARRNAFNAD